MTNNPCIKLSRESPVVEFSTNNLLHSKVKFLVDTGVDMNMFKVEAIDRELLDDKNESIQITGITQSRISTIGTVNMQLME